MTHWIVKDAADLEGLVARLGSLKLPLTVEWRQGADRTKQQNKLSWLWAAEVAMQRGDAHADEVRADWKVRFGFPILREASEDFRQTYDRNMRRIPQDEIVEFVRVTDLPVTRGFKVPEMIRWMDAVQHECVSQQFRITDPDPELAKYQARYRVKEAA